MDIEVEAGDYGDIDEWIEKMKSKGYTADYENLMSGISQWWAKATVSDGIETINVFWEGTDFGHMVVKVG